MQLALARSTDMDSFLFAQEWIVLIDVTITSAAAKAIPKN